MAASIDVGMKLAVEVKDEAFFIGAVDWKQELQRFSGLHIANSSDFES